MKVELDDHYLLFLNRWGSPELIHHLKNPKVYKNGLPHGKSYYFQTFGQAIKFYIKQSASKEDLKSLEDMAAYIDKKLKDVELRIDQMLKENKNEN